jgi:transcriptional regulator with XRE-family HTH domain
MVASQSWSVRSGADIGRAIADIRARHGLTQLGLAEQSGLSRGYLAQIESGKTVSLLEHELRILRRLGATVTITIERDDGSA